MNNETLRTMTIRIHRNKDTMPSSGLVGRNRTEVLRNLGGHRVRCTSGILWVTIEGDPKDYVLTQNQSLSIPNLGKVILSGPGSYQV
jgi:hypothetical protein